jgi:hypothetical protein
VEYESRGRHHDSGPKIRTLIFPLDTAPNVAHFRDCNHNHNMRSITAKALAALPPAPFTVGQTDTDYSQGPEARRTRAIRDRRGVDLVYLVATTMLVCEGEPLEENNPARIQSANATAAAWSKVPELIAALGDLLDGLQSGHKPDARVIEYAERVLRETERAILSTTEDGTAS